MQTAVYLILFIEIGFNVFNNVYLRISFVCAKASESQVCQNTDDTLNI